MKQIFVLGERGKKMSKAIAEIEKPKCCKDCVWYQADPRFGGSCAMSKDENGWNKGIGADEEYNVQKWCPLLPKSDIIPVEWIANKAKELYQYSIGTPENDDDYYKRCAARNESESLKTVLHLWRDENEERKVDQGNRGS